MAMYRNWMVPADVDQRVISYQQRICDERNLKPTEFSKSGDAMRELLSLAEAAQRLGLRADTLAQLEQPAQP